jgi:outer membrane protein, heavy metal efflux system
MNSTNIIPVIILSAVALAFMPAVAKATAADSLRIENVAVEAVQNNNRAAAARYMETAAREKIGPAGAWNDPMLMVGVTSLPTSFDFKMDPMTMKMIGISQSVPIAGQKGLAAKAAKSEADAASEDRRGVEIDLATAARTAFLDLYFRQKALAEIKDQRSLMNDIVNAATARVRSNQAGQADISAAQADLWRLDVDILSSEQEIDRARYDLCTLIGRNAKSDLPPLAEPSSPAIPDNINPWLDQARGSYPPYQRLNRLADSYAFASRSAARMRWPMLDLSANYGIRSDGPMEKRDNMIGFQAAINLPIFAGHKQSDMARSMTAMKQSTDAEANQMWREIEAALRTLHAKAGRLQKSLAIYTDQILPADQDAYRSALAGYADNRTSFADLLTFAIAIYRDRISVIQIRSDLARTLVEVGKYTSVPFDQIQNEKSVVKE